MLRMADSTDPRALPAGFDAYAGYVGGRWPDFDPICQRFPTHAKAGRVVSVAVNAQERARILDVENGDAVPSEAGPWLLWMLSLGEPKPGVYTSLSVMPQVISSINAHGVDRSKIVLWVADWNNREDVPPGFEAHQFADRGSIDVSVATPEFFPGPATPHKNPTRYEWFDVRRRTIAGGLSERIVVQRYDALRRTQTPTRHPHRLQLAACRGLLRVFAGRVWHVAHRERNPLTGRPSWGKDHRGWRFRQLSGRAHGTRFV